MKLHFSILLFFMGFLANAGYKSATVYYTNGQSEKGLINSFLEDNFFDFNFFGTFEEGLIYNDKSIKFKTDENADTKRISIDDIDRITLHYDTFDKQYKALFIKGIDKRGILQTSNVRIFLPLLRSGKINIYGFYHTETQTNHSSNTPSYTTTVTEVFYYQNANENYAFDYYDIEIQDIFNLRDRLANPLKDLFKDCPQLMIKVHNIFYEENLTKEEKKKIREQSKASWKALQREYREIPSNKKRGDLLLYHQYNMKQFDDLLMEYENCK